MHAQAHMSGQFSGKVPNQAGSQLPGLPHPNGSSIPPQMQNLTGMRNTGTPISDVARRHVGEKIYQYLQHRITPEMQPRMKDLVRRLEEMLCKSASSQEEYLNMETLEQRLQLIFRRQPHGNRSQQLQHSMSSTGSAGTMIPTPGMPHSGNINLTGTSSVDHSMVAISSSSAGVPNTMNGGKLLPTVNGSSGGIHGASFSSSDGHILNGYQQSPVNMTIGSGGNSLMPSLSLQRPVSQMIPTPGLNNTQPAMDSEPSKKGGFFSGVDSTMSLKPQQPKQSVGGQNSRILQNLGGQMGIGLRSSLQQKSFSYGFSNGTPSSALGLIGNNMQSMNVPAASEGHLTASAYGCSPASPRSSSQHFDHQRQQNLMQSDRYGMNPTDLSGMGNLYGTAASVGSTLSQQNTYPQTAHVKSHTVDQSPKINFQARHASQQQLQKLQQQEIQKQPQLFQQHFVHHQQKPQSQQHNHLLISDEVSQSQLASNLGSQVIAGQGLESHAEVQHSKVPEQFQLPELQNQFQQKAAHEDCSGGEQILWNSSGPDDFCSPLSQNSQQMQHIMNQQQVSVDSQNNFSSISAGEQPEALLQGQWHSKSQDKLHIIGQSSHEQHVQEEFHQRIKGQDEAQRPHLSSKGPMTTPKDVTRENFDKQRWLLFLRHARKCLSPEGKCPSVYCISAQNLLKHIEGCKVPKCSYPRCYVTKVLLQHHKYCQEADCSVCTPVNHYVEVKRKARVCPPSATTSPNSVYESWKSVDAGDAAQLALNTGTTTVEVSDDLHSMVKRMKMEHPSMHMPKSESSPVNVPVISQPHVSQDAQTQVCNPVDMPMTVMTVKSELAEVKRASSVNSGRGTPSFNEIKKDTTDDGAIRSDYGPIVSHGPAALAKQESIEDEKISGQVKQEKEMENAPPPVEAGTKSGKPKINGVSLIELFTPEQIRRHIFGLRQWVGQSKAKAEKNQAMEHSMSENSCQLCAVEKLTFEPPPIYCTSCGVRIKRNAMYYTMGSGDTQRFFCIPCYNEARGDAIEVDGTSTPKARLEKKKNDEETEEWWVQCDKCEAWQHQICALFNGRRNDGGQAEYTCPNCCMEEIEKGERKPLPQSAVLGAKDLPRTILSDHIEQRLFRRLKQERQERARVLGKHCDEVPGAEALVVRVVSSVDKKLEVKQRFLEIFQEENYPTEFPYKSKVILLFQKIEGVEVCLFGMYVQEFGSESQFPNQRRVYLSYLDSVKYFRPEIKAVTGEALRTFVYHEILIGYLEYCKKRGFTSCYIWACPPLKGEDYILYCHPEIQKTPKSDKLREWYLSMLRKAAKESIVVELTNLYDHFFVTTGECKAKVTAARLPYFDGDYWPGAAEDMINQLRQEEDGRKQQKKGKTKKTITKRALKAAGHTDLSANASKDVMLMQKLGETISPMKEDFIMVHLQHACTHCCHLMVSGIRWTCNQCKNFQLCDKCYDAEQKLDERDRHPTYSRDKHSLHPVEINDVSEDTKDMDDILESEFFDTRQAFLSLCQGNHYQYDTLRRAKHSSMMVLYHLHNPTAPAFVTTCNVCCNDVEAGHGWRCEICPDYDVCNSCYQKDGGVDHDHKLTNHPSSADRDAQNKEARQQRVVQLRKMLDLLVHASRCRFLQCPYPNCRKVKGLFRHGIQCKTRASGGCVLCKKMWYILQLHARACKESECHVPRCKDLKEHLRRLQQQSDSRRRAAVMEMMRQRAAEVAGSSG